MIKPGDGGRVFSVVHNVKVNSCGVPNSVVSGTVVAISRGDDGLKGRGRFSSANGALFVGFFE